MDTRAMFLTMGFTGALMTSAVQAGQHEQHQAAGTDATATTAVAECRQVQAAVTATIEGALKRLEEARLTNSPAVMRATADQLQTAFLDIRTQLAPCTQIPTSDAGHATSNVPLAPPVAPGTPQVAPQSPAQGAQTAPGTQHSH